jgi:hypothetical protein
MRRWHDKGTRKQQRGLRMKQDISEMAPAGTDSEKLDIQHYVTNGLQETS